MIAALALNFYFILFIALLLANSGMPQRPDIFVRMLLTAFEIWGNNNSYDSSE